MEDIRSVTLPDVLAARDARVQRQTAILDRHGVPLLSFTMNIAGPVKCDPQIRRAFGEGVRLIRREMERMALPVLAYEETVAFTGCEAIWAVQGDAAALKTRMCAIEDASPLGRLFDIDVINADGSHLSRQEERTCLICGGPVRACARSRAHSAEELFRKAHAIIDGYFQSAFVRQIASQAQRALLYEALTTPKPGLVDCLNSGAHRDMDLFSFADSACTLRSYFEDCVHIGIQGASPVQLQYAGLLAEDSMLSAAKANTHKGAIFSLGILCCAAGACGENAALADVLARAAELGAFFLRRMQEERRDVTGGEQQYLQYGLTGARGEAASGFQTVQNIGLPALEEAITAGKSLPDAGLDALLRLMAHVQDSNIIRRAGLEGQAWIMAQARMLMERGYTTNDLLALDQQCIQRNISPGGSADLLAVTYFLYFLQAGQADGRRESP